MGNLSEYHRYLFLGKITGSLTEAEQRELDELFAFDPNALHEFERFAQTLPPDDVSRSFDYLNNSNFWKDHLPGEIKRQQFVRRRNNFLKYAAVAVVVTGIIIPILLWNNNTTPVKDNAKIPAITSKAVVLKTANGKLINLHTDTGLIDGKFYNRDGALVCRGTDESTGVNTITVPAGKEYCIELADGTQVWLNSATSFEFIQAFNGKTREVTIAGEAYLQVAEDASKPFLVHLPQSVVEVTGTEFNVNSYQDELVKVALVKGSVNIKSSQAVLALAPGNQALFNKISNKITREPFNEKKELSWRKGLYYFESATLQDISTVLKRWFDIDTAIDNPRLQSRKFAGLLNKNEPIEVFLDNMRNISRIEIYFDKQGVLHFK